MGQARRLGLLSLSNSHAQQCMLSDHAPLVPPCSCNSVAFAGSIFVRSREEQQFVRERGPLHVLTATGFPW